MDKVKKSLQQLGIEKDIITMFVICLLVFISFMIFLWQAGIPATKARNSYNEALLLYESGEYVEAQELLEESLATWETREARELLETIESEV